MNNFTFTRAIDEPAALGAMSRTRGSAFIAGGTNILDLMKDAVERPPALVDINALPLRSIELRADGFHIGALARMSDVALDPDIRHNYPCVAIALEESASPQLRNMASMGGNVLQRTRCPYFRDTASPCNKRDPGSGCGAMGGVNRREAVLGTSDKCIATHPSDLAVALAALDAHVLVTGMHGTRNIAMSEFYRVPGETPHIETTLAPGELITGLLLPILPYAKTSTYLKVRDRAQYEFALTSAAVALDIARDGNGGAPSIRQARVALGGVGTVPWRSRGAERVLAGAPATRDTFVRAAEAALAGARGYGQNDFKIPLAKRTLVLALENVAGMTA